MKTLLKLLAWAGVALFALGAVSAYIGSASLSSSRGAIDPPVFMAGFWLIGLVLGGIGAFLALLGGLIARPRGLWIGLIIVSVLYGLSFWETIYSNGIGVFLFFCLPGLVCIVEGIVLKLRRPQAKPVTNHV